MKSLRNESYKKDWERSVEDLYNSYPLTFYKKPYISVDIGWHGILHEVGSKTEKIIQKILKENNLSLVDSADLPFIWQIKEKYGTLRIEFSSVPIKYADEIFAIETEAEEKSSVTCERCSKPASLTESGWIQVLCPEHTS